MKFISDTEAIRNILEENGRYMFWIGAGFSAEAGVKTARHICDDIKDDLLALHETDYPDPLMKEKWLKEYLDWDDHSKRYMTCLQRFYPNEAKRNEFFHKILVDAQPSLCHYSLALLISNGLIRSTCFTTNFDHLIENAFTQQDMGRFQAIRTDDECRYWQDRNDRYYIVKLHGDIDTQNVMNTRKETIQLSDAMSNLIRSTSHNSGLVVIGTAGNEKSVRKIFEDWADKSKSDRTIWSFGLLWGVYMGEKKPIGLTRSELEKLLEQRIKETEINEDIANVIQDSSNDLFCFFPIWGAGNFMFDLVKASKNKELIGKASLHLDHEMRLRFIYSNAGLTENAIEQHLQNLRHQREKRDKARPESDHQPDLVLKAQNALSNVEVRILYGDITSRSFMSNEEFRNQRRAIISPEDTCITAGGGVAYTILLKSGQKSLLNELAKFSPIPQNSVAITSAGNLPLHYIFHAASLKIEADGNYSVSKQNVRQTMSTVLEKTQSLEIGVLWVPLMAAGAASLKPIDSFEAILGSIEEYEKSHNSSLTVTLVIMVMIYQEKTIPRHYVIESFNKILSPSFNLL